jgi:hypothetical protein
MKSAGVVSPTKGAHLLRHIAATGMPHCGALLDRITPLRMFRACATTYYAKADLSALSGDAAMMDAVQPRTGSQAYRAEIALFQGESVRPRWAFSLTQMI